MRSRSRQQQKLKGITGLSLDPDGFSVAHVVRNGAEPARLEVCAYQPLEPGEEPAPQIASLLREHSLEQTPCVFALRPGQYSLRQIDAPPVAPDELRDAARWALKDLVDFDVVEAVVDVFEVPAASPSRPDRVYAVAAESSEIDAVVALVQSAGLELVAIDIAELALRNLTALLPEDEGGVAIMVLQGGCGLLIATIAGTLHLARNVHADRLAIEELSRCDAAEPKPDSEEDSMLLDSFLLEAQRSLDYCEHQLALPPIQTVALGMTDPATPALEQHLSAGLNAHVMSLDLNQLLDVGGIASALAQAHCLRAVGAALRQEAGR